MARRAGLRGCRVAAALLLFSLLSPAAEARRHQRHGQRQLCDMRTSTAGTTRYGSYTVKERVLASGARFKLIKHFDHTGHRIASSLVMYGPRDGQLREKIKLRGAVSAATARTAADVWGMHLRLTRVPHRVSTAAAAAVDLSTGKIYYGKSGHPRPSRIADLLKRRTPPRSLESWRVDNCGEFKAVNKALNNGASIDNLVVHTVKTSSGKAFPRCHNCQLTTAGAVVTSDAPR